MVTAVCPRCHGIGRIGPSKSESCWWCNGTGQVERDPVDGTLIGEESERDMQLDRDERARIRAEAATLEADIARARRSARIASALWLWAAIGFGLLCFALFSWGLFMVWRILWGSR